MSREKDSNQPRPPLDTGTAKKPYWKPTFRHELVFETMALACGKITPVTFPCQSRNRLS